MISRSQMNRQLYQMGGEGMQAGMQEGIMQMAPQEMQQMDAEQYRPVAEQLAQDPNQALMAIVRMLMEQGIPEEEAIKIAKQMIQAVAEGNIEELSDDARVEARFGGRIGYAEGGIGRLVNREQYGFGSIFKGVKKVVKGAAKAVKSVAKSKIGRIALTIAAAYALGPAGLNIGAGMSPFAAGALKAGIANLGVQAVSGQGFNFKEALLAAGLGGVTAGLTTPGQTGGFDGTEGVFNTSTSGGLENLTMPTASSGFPQTTLGGFGMDNIPVDSAAPAASASFTSPLTPTASNFDYSGLSSDFDSNVFTDARPGVKSLGSFGTAEASTTFPQGDMVTTPTGFNSGYSQFGSGDTQFGFGKDAIDISNTPPVYKQTSFGKTIGEVETPLSQRYDTFKSALGEGNYLDALKQVSGVALDYPLTTIGGISTLASAMTPEIPEQLPGESMEEYRARVAEFERQYASNLSGRTGPSLPASANNPFYPVYAARGGRIGYQEGSMPMGEPRRNPAGIMELDYRNEGGFVPPIGIKERADDIPAMLSNNEFVFTADAVKNAGGGDPNVGAQKMYTLMKRLESGGRV
jgi:hypothetical protein